MNQIQLNNTVYNLEKTKTKLLENLPDWEKNIFLFLVEWFSDRTTISIQTSGSTGTPKLISRNKKTLENSALMTGEYFDFKENQTALLCLPAKYIAGKMMLVRAIVWKLDLLYIEPKIKLSVPNQAIQFCAMTPPQVEANLKNLAEITNLIIGGAPISPILEEQIISLKTTCFATFGMTETVSHIALREINTTQNTIYKILPGVEIDSTKDGCLIIKAPHLLNQPIITTDLIKLRGKTSFEWLGRLDYAINTGGVKIHPEIIEKKISSLIPQSFIIAGKPSVKWGEEVLLIIESQSQSDSVLTEAIKGVLTNTEIPKSIYFIPEFIRTENGKVNRKKTLGLICTDN